MSNITVPLAIFKHTRFTKGIHTNKLTSAISVIGNERVTPHTLLFSNKFMLTLYIHLEQSSYSLHKDIYYTTKFRYIESCSLDILNRYFFMS